MNQNTLNTWMLTRGQQPDTAGLLVEHFLSLKFSSHHELTCTRQELMDFTGYSRKTLSKALRSLTIDTPLWSVEDSNLTLTWTPLVPESNLSTTEMEKPVYSSLYQVIWENTTQTKIRQHLSLALASKYYPEVGYVHIRYAELERETGWSVNTIKKTLKELIDSGEWSLDPHHEGNVLPSPDLLAFLNVTEEKEVETIREESATFEEGDFLDPIPETGETDRDEAPLDLYPPMCPEEEESAPPDDDHENLLSASSPNAVVATTLAKNDAAERSKRVVTQKGMMSLPFMLYEVSSMHRMNIRPFMKRKSSVAYATNLYETTDLSTRKAKSTFTIANLTRLYDSLSTVANMEVVDTLMTYQCETAGALHLKFMTLVAQRVERSHGKPPKPFKNEEYTSATYQTALMVWKIIQARRTNPRAIEKSYTEDL